jgi:hypothetical protein
MPARGGAIERTVPTGQHQADLEPTRRGVCKEAVGTSHKLPRAVSHRSTTTS